jgi:ABC-type branched-subunit amino acid transport system substrate-binding protein
MNLPKARIGVGVLALLGLLAAGCGDSGNSAGNGDGSSPSTTTGPGATTSSAASTDPLKAIGIDLKDCGSNYKPTEGITASEIVIGQSIPKSGPSQAFSLLSTGMKAYFDYANAELGGVNGRKLKLVDLDDGYEPAKTAQNVQQLIGQGTFAFSGILGTPNNLAVRDVLNDSCIPQLFPSTGAPDWGEVQDYPWTVGGAVIPYNDEARMWADYLKKSFPNGAKVVALEMDNEFGKDYEDWFRNYIAGSNIQLVKVEKHDPLAADVNNQMTTLAATKADVAIAMTTSSFCTRFMKALENNDWKPVQIISGTCKSSIFFAGGGGGAVGALVVGASKEIADPAYANDPDAQRITGLIKKYAPDAPIAISLVPLGWLYGDVLRDVLVRADKLPGGLTRPNVIVAARQTNMTSPLLYDGVQLKLDGVKDAYLVEAGRFDKWNGTTFEKVTDLYQYEGTTKPKP